MRELKHEHTPEAHDEVSSRTLPRVRELKQLLPMIIRFLGSRTLPRVRELKLKVSINSLISTSRTLPRVRELKPVLRQEERSYQVAPFPGCVN